MINEKKAVKKLNDHHERYCAGFYPSTGGRAFGARIRKGQAEITYDFKTFVPVDLQTVTFHDFGGRDIPLPTVKETV